MPHDMAAKVAAARKARRHLFIIARTDAAASEGMDGALARAKLYLEAGADAIFPEALNNREMFAEFARRTCEGRAAAREHDRVRPHALLHRRSEFQDMGYQMVIWPVPPHGSPTRRCRNCIPPSARRRHHKLVDRMQTRAELYDTIGLACL